MPTPAQKARLGLFLFAGTFLLVGMLMITVGFTSEQPVGFYMSFNESVNGLSEGSQVKYRGLPVGSVSDMRIEADNSILIEVAIVPSRVRLYRGTLGRLDRSSLVGSVFIQLEGGDPHLGALAPGETIETTPSLGKQIADDLPMIIRDASLAISRINNTIEAISRDQLGRIVEETGGLVTSVQGAVDETRRDLATVLDETRAAIASLNAAGETVVRAASTVDRVVDGLDAPVRDVVATVDTSIEGLDLQATGRSLREAVERLDRITLALEATLHDADLQVVAVGSELTRTLQEVQRLVDAIERDPSMVLFGRRQPPAGALPE